MAYWHACVVVYMSVCINVRIIVFLSVRYDASSMRPKGKCCISSHHTLRGQYLLCHPLLWLLKHLISGAYTDSLSCGHVLQHQWMLPKICSIESNCFCLYWRFYRLFLSCHSSVLVIYQLFFS